MESKTPKFDAFIEKILNELTPHLRFCDYCKKEFSIEECDIEFLKMFKVPAPKLCPSCRQQRRLSAANYSTIFNNS